MPQNKAPDVSVRLTAEGVQDVVKAFQKIQQEAEKTGKGAHGAGEGAAYLKEQLAGIAEVLPALTVAAGVLGFVEMAKSAAESAVQVGKLEQKTGISAKTLSTFRFAAQQTGQDVDGMSKGLIKATRFFDEYDQGAQKAKDTVANLFGNQDALKGLNEDQRIIKITDALAKLEPGAKRTGAAIAIFGKAGAELLPVLDKLGSKGFAELQAKAEKFGVAVDEDMVRAAEDAHGALLDMQAAAQGAATQFDSGFLPAVADAANAIVDGLAGDGAKGFKTFGEVAGSVLRFVITFLGTVVAGFYKAGTEIGSFALRLAQFQANVVQGVGIRNAWQLFISDLKADNQEINSAIDARLAKMQQALDGAHRDKDGTKPRDRDRSKSTDVNDEALKSAKALAEAQRKLTEANLDAEIAILKAKNKQAEDAEKEKYSRGLVGIQDYYRDRAARINAEADKEIALIESKIAAEQKAEDFERNRGLKKGETEGERQAAVLARQAAIAKLSAERDVAGIGRDTALNSNANEQLNDVRELAKAQLEAEAAVASAEGRRFDAERLALQAEVAGLQRLKGESDAAFKARQNSLNTSGTQKIDFEQLQQQGKLALDALAVDRKHIQDEVSAGQLDQLNADEQLRQAELARLPVLQQIAAQMQAAAVTDEQKQSAADFSANIDQIGISSNKAADYHRQLVGAFEQGINSGINGFFDNLKSGAGGVVGAFKALAAGVVGSLQQVIQQMITTMITARLMKAIFGAATGGGSSVVSGFGGGAGVVAAGGGYITGPGTGTSDSIPARLSDGEFVVRSAVVAQPGMLSMLAALNNSSVSVLGNVRRRHFADGGLVSAVDPVAAGGASTHAGLSASLDLDAGLVLKKLEASPEWSRVHVRTAQQNAKKLNNALGR